MCVYVTSSTALVPFMAGCLFKTPRCGHRREAYLGLKTNRRFRSLRDVVRKARSSGLCSGFWAFWGFGLRLKVCRIWAGRRGFQGAGVSVGLWGGFGVLGLIGLS